MDKTNASNVFRSKAPDPTPEKPAEYKKDVPVGGEAPDTSGVPFTEYRTMNAQPFLVEYFDLGDSWQEKMGGFEKEVDLIEGYFKDKIEQGSMKNETDVVKDEIKKIYKLTKIDKSERTTMQIEKLAAYIEFLKRTDKIEVDRYRYR